MVQKETFLTVADNTGAKVFKLIGILGQNRDYATVGDLVKGSIQESTPDAQFKSGAVVLGVIVRVKSSIYREDGSSVRFDDNAVVIIGADNNPKGTRVFGPVARELRNKFMKIVSLAPEVV